MGLYSALSIGSTALRASQVALETIGNNIANANTENYSRQDVILVPGASVGDKLKVGTGVQISQLIRRYDAAVESRLRTAISDNASAVTQNQVLSRIEGLFNETTDSDLSSALTGFFNAFSELANNPQDLGVRTIVVEKSRELVNMIDRLRSGLDGLRAETDNAVKTAVQEVNRISNEIADLNNRIILSEKGNLGSAPGLRDERDARLRELSELVDIRCIEQNTGAVNVIIGNQILVDGRTARELTIDTAQDRNLAVSEIRFSDNGEELSPSSGTILGLITARDEYVGGQIDRLDQLVQALVIEVNAIHAEGVGTEQLSEVRSENFVRDDAAVLNSEDAGLFNAPRNGSFIVHITNSVTGLSEATLINVDLDGIGVDDSLQTLAAKLDAVTNLDASIDATGRLVLTTASPELRISFTEDSSQFLAAMGINSFFTGYDSITIGLNQAIVDNPRLIAASLDGQTGNSGNALRLAGLADDSLDSLGGVNVIDFHTSATTRLAVTAAASQSAVRATEAFLNTMSDEREAVSGVNLDEEAIDLIRYQKAYAAAAKYMSVVSDMLDAIMQI